MGASGGRIQAWLKKPVAEVRIEWSGVAARDAKAAGPQPFDVPDVRPDGATTSRRTVRVRPAEGLGVTGSPAAGAVPPARPREIAWGESAPKPVRLDVWPADPADEFRVATTADGAAVRSVVSVQLAAGRPHSFVVESPVGAAIGELPPGWTAADLPNVAGTARRVIDVPASAAGKGTFVIARPAGAEAAGRPPRVVLADGRPAAGERVPTAAGAVGPRPAAGGPIRVLRVAVEATPHAGRWLYRAAYDVARDGGAAVTAVLPPGAEAGGPTARTLPDAAGGGRLVFAWSTIRAASDLPARARRGPAAGRPGPGVDDAPAARLEGHRHAGPVRGDRRPVGVGVRPRRAARRPAGWTRPASVRPAGRAGVAGGRPGAHRGGGGAVRRRVADGAGDGRAGRVGWGGGVRPGGRGGVPAAPGRRGRRPGGRAIRAVRRHYAAGG